MRTRVQHGDSIGMVDELAAVVCSVAHTDLPADAIEAGVRLVQHALGVTLAGAQLAVVRTARSAIGNQPGPCTIFGSALLHPAQDAAFVNAVNGHASLLEDSGPGGQREGSHPATYVFPAALAVAEQLGASGIDFVRAICAAYEVVSRLGAASPAQLFARGFRVVAVLGPFGAAAAAGALMRLTRTQLAASFGIAANLSGGFNQGFLDGTMEPYLHAAFAARNGILAARLGAAGATASHRSLEGDLGFFKAFAGAAGDHDALTRPSTELAVCRVGTKRFATCLYNQGTLSLLQGAFAGGLRAADIERVVVARPSAGINGLSAPGVASAPPHSNMLQRQMSARYTAAAALLNRPVDSAAYFEESTRDADVDDVARRIELVVHESPGIDVEVVLRGGQTRRAHAGGDSPLDFSSVVTCARFIARARPVLGDDVHVIADMIAGLPLLDNVCRLTARLRSRAATQAT